MNTINKKWKPDVEGAWQAFYLRAQAEAPAPVAAEEEELLSIEEELPPVEEESPPIEEELLSIEEESLPEAGGVSMGDIPLGRMQYARTGLISRKIPAYVWWCAAALFCGLCLWSAWMFWPSVIPLPPKTEAVALLNPHDNEVLVSTLPDGTVLFLYGGSEVTYSYSELSPNREVTLNGEAFFEVFKDEKRPFVIENESFALEVKGTSFRIRTDREHPFELSVKSGMVQVVLKNDDQKVFAEAGEQIELVDNWLQKSYSEELPILHGDLRKLYFRDESLWQIVRAVNECTDGPIHLALEDESLYDQRITVGIDLEKGVERIAGIICTALQVEQTVKGDVIYIGKR